MRRTSAHHPHLGSVALAGPRHHGACSAWPVASAFADDDAAIKRDDDAATWSWSPTTTTTTPTTTPTTTRRQPEHRQRAARRNDDTNSRFTAVSRDRDHSRERQDPRLDPGRQRRPRSATGRPTRPTTGRATTPALTASDADEPATTGRGAFGEGDAHHRRADRDAAARRWLGVRGLPRLRRDHLRAGRGQGAPPGQVTDGASLRGLRREVAALAAVNHPVVVRGLRHAVDGDAPARRARAHRRTAAVVADPPLRAAAGAAVPAAGDRHRLGAALLRGTSATSHLDIKPSNIIMGAPARADRPVRRPHRAEAAAA